MVIRNKRNKLVEFDDELAQKLNLLFGIDIDLVIEEAYGTKFEFFKTGFNPAIKRYTSILVKSNDERDNIEVPIKEPKLPIVHYEINRKFR